LTDPAARLYYLRATARFGWTRNVLLNQIKAHAYERAMTEKKTHNFPLALPEHLAEQADEMLKSSYNLEFLGLRRAVKERELEDRLISRLQAFLLELGYGFCFVGRQYRLTLGQIQSKLPEALKGKLPTAKQLADVVRTALPERSAP
jgi:predicted nuclease of restriction endonuclease-like (RecB) superfamily